MGYPTIKKSVEENLKSLEGKRPELKDNLAALSNRSASMTANQLSILDKRLIDFTKAHDLLMTIKKNNEWMVSMSPKLFDAANAHYHKLEHKLLESKKLDVNIDPNWRELNHKMTAELTRLATPLTQVKETFLKHFGPKLKQSAEKFFDDYKIAMELLAQQKEALKSDPVFQKKVDIAAFDAEIDKQLKLVQAQLVLANTAAEEKEKSINLKLAATALAGLSMAVAGAGVGAAAVGAVGTVVPVIGTAIGAATGLVAGGIIGGLKGYHEYKEAKARYQDHLARILIKGDFDDAPEKEVLAVNEGIASIKTFEAFNWLMQGPQEADYDRMIRKYKLANPGYSDQQISDLKIKLCAEFDISRASYFSMLNKIIRASTADSALQAAADISIAPPFDVYSALDIATQFTSICDMQVKAAQIILGTSSTTGNAHIDVMSVKGLAYKTATHLASNAEALAALYHQIVLCTNLDEAKRNALLEDIRQSLIKTIENYDQLVNCYPSLSLKANLGEALMSGVFMDIEHMGHENTPKKHHSKEHRAYSAVMDYMKHSKFHHSEYGFHQTQNKTEKKKSTIKSAVELADVLLNTMLGTASAAFLGATVATTPEVINSSMVGASEFSTIGIGVGGALAGLALAAGSGAYYLSKKAEEHAENICTFGNVTKRREALHDSLGKNIREAYATESKLHSLIDAPDTVYHLDRARNKDTLISPQAAATKKHYVGVAQLDKESIINRQTSYGSRMLDKLTCDLPGVLRSMYYENFDESLLSIKKTLTNLNEASQHDKLGVGAERKILELLDTHFGKMKDEFKLIFNAHPKEDEYNQILKSVEGEVNSFLKTYKKHLTIAQAEPRNFKAIAMDADRLNHTLQELVQLLSKSDFSNQGKINNMTDQVRSIISFHNQQLPEGTDIELLHTVLENSSLHLESENVAELNKLIKSVIESIPNSKLQPDSDTDEASNRNIQLT